MKRDTIVCNCEGTEQLRLFYITILKELIQHEKAYSTADLPLTFRGITHVVMEIDGNPQIVEIPGEIDGVPVTELAEYLFSGKSCQVIRIPSGVWKIGRYGFYNCRELEELWFPVISQILEAEPSQAVTRSAGWKCR